MNRSSSLSSFRVSHRLVRGAVFCAVAAITGVAGADDRPRVLYDLQLNSSIIRLEAIDALSVTFEDEYGAIRTRLFKRGCAGFTGSRGHGSI